MESNSDFKNKQSKFFGTIEKKTLKWVVHKQ